MQFGKALPLIIVFLFASLCFPSWGYAFQPHPTPEGLYVHQMAHLLFIGALVYLYWHIGQSSLLVSRGWHYLRLFCLFFMVWNCMTFAGHTADSYLTVADFANLGTWHSKILLPISLLKLVYYFGRFEHLVSVPGTIFLFMGLRIFYKEVCAEVNK